MLWVYYQKFPLPISIPEIRPGSGIKANDFILSDIHADSGSACSERAADRRDSGRRDVLGQLCSHGAFVGFDDGFFEESASRQV